MKKKKFLTLLLAGAMVCSMMTGCSINLDMLSKGPSTAVEVVENYKELMSESSNYHADMDMDFEIGAESQGFSMELPISISLSADVLDGNMHGDMDMSMTFWGEKMKQSMEIYVEAGRKTTTTYSYSDEDGYWTVSEEASGADMAMGFADIDSSCFEDAVMEYNKTKGTYTITQSFSDFMDMGSVYDTMEDTYSGMAEMMDIDTEDFLEEWENAEVIYVFDDEFYLLSVDVEGCEYTGTVRQDGVKVNVSVILELSFEFSDYGKIKKSDVEVPDDVADSAVPSISMDLDDDNYDVNINIDYDFGDDDYYDDYDYEEEYEPPVEVSVPDNFVLVTDDDVFGSYDGIILTCMGDSWDATFGADGWEFANEDGEYSFLTAQNPKYNGAELYVYNLSRNNTTRSDIQTYGIYGYNIDCSWASSYPDMTWNGITFGASAEDIFAVYGEPAYIYEGNTYTTYEYEITEDIEITFYVASGEGLNRVTVSNYTGL